MTYITVNYPNLAEGAEVELDGLGLFKNGEPQEVNDGDVEVWRQRNAAMVEEYTDPDEKQEQELVGMTVAPGLTLGQYFKNNSYVTVSAKDPNAKTEKEAKKND